MDLPTQPVIQVPTPQSNQPSSQSPQHPIDKLSANSKRVRRFETKQKFRTILFILIIGIPLALGFAAYVAYKRTVSPANSTSNQPLETVAPDNGISNPTAPGATNAPLGTANPELPSSPAQSGQQNSNSGQVSNKIPDGVTVAINSIEANGIKNNPYVNIDTSNIPDGTVIKVDRKSWTQFGPEQIAVNGTVTVYGQNRQGSLTFGLVNGTWKVINYTVVS